MSNVELKGEHELFAELEKRFGEQAMQEANDNALRKGAELFVEYLNASIGTSGHYAKGWTVEDTTIGEPETIAGVRTIKVHWNGPHGRYRIIHLNEYGTVKNPNPPRKGAIARAMRNAETAYREVIKQSITEGVTQ